MIKFWPTTRADQIHSSENASSHRLIWNSRLLLQWAYRHFRGDVLLGAATQNKYLFKTTFGLHKEVNSPSFQRHTEKTTSPAEHKNIMAWSRLQRFRCSAHGNRHHIARRSCQVLVKEVGQALPTDWNAACMVRRSTMNKCILNHLNPPLIVMFTELFWKKCKSFYQIANSSQSHFILIICGIMDMGLHIEMRCKISLMHHF